MHTSFKITENFCIEEFFCSQLAAQLNIVNNPNPEHAKEVMVNVVRVAILLQKVRDVLQIPITVTSGFRCAALNNRLKNAVPNSLHLDGAAADIVCSNMQKLYIALKKVISKTNATSPKPLARIVDEGTWYHIQLEDCARTIPLAQYIKCVDSLL